MHVHPLPHRYSVAAAGSAGGAVTLATPGAPALASAAPREFDGAGDQWSPEALLIAAVASCFILTFRAIARAGRLEWTRLQCTVEGKLERIDGVMRFTHLATSAVLTVPAESNTEPYRRALEKAESSCLISNSLNARRELHADVVVLDAAARA
jgi:organic hydroperoxide reductase OsmC/OhrA